MGRTSLLLKRWEYFSGSRTLRIGNRTASKTGGLGFFLPRVMCQVHRRHEMRKFNFRNAIIGQSMFSGQTNVCAKSNMLRVVPFALCLYLRGWSIPTTSSGAGFLSGILSGTFGTGDQKFRASHCLDANTGRMLSATECPTTRCPATVTGPTVGLGLS